jgi:hypothetical protein
MLTWFLILKQQSIYIGTGTNIPKKFGLPQRQEEIIKFKIKIKIIIKNKVL